MNKVDSTSPLLTHPGACVSLSVFLSIWCIGKTRRRTLDHCRFLVSSMAMEELALLNLQVSPQNAASIICCKFYSANRVALLG